MSLEDLFRGMAEANPNGNGTNMGVGQYLVEVTNLKMKKGFKGRSLIVEFKILESNNDKHPVGSSGSYVRVMDNKDPKLVGYAFSDMKAIFLALDGKDPKKVKDVAVDPQTHADALEMSRLALDDDYCKAKGLEPGFLNGTKLRLETILKKTAPSVGKPQGGEFTVHNWAPVEERAA